jgi:hypothetical protein
MIDHIVDLVEDRARTCVRARDGEGLSDAAAPPAGHVRISLRYRAPRALKQGGSFAPFGAGIRKTGEQIHTNVDLPIDRSAPPITSPA